MIFLVISLVLIGLVVIQSALGREFEPVGVPIMVRVSEK
jgi:hypothetical protein